MFDQLKKILGVQPPEDFAALVKGGAQIIDVRSKEEYSSGHLKGSVKIPLQSLQGQLNKISKEKPVIVCCASGMRSGSAKSVLQAKGYTVYNGGGWTSLERKIRGH
jgi:phage shock protein E